MIGWLSSWAQAIIIAVVIGIIIEMILPEGSSKKYIKVVVGVYILFTIISPVITKFTDKSLTVSETLQIEEYIDTVKEKELKQNLLQEENSASIREIYIGNLKADIQNKLKGKGYIVTNIILDVGNDDNYTLRKIILSISKKENQEEVQDETKQEIEIINEVNIGTWQQEENDVTKERKKARISSTEQKQIKEYLSSVYEINEKNIVIEDEKVVGNP